MIKEAQKKIDNYINRKGKQKYMNVYHNLHFLNFQQETTPLTTLTLELKLSEESGGYREKKCP